MSAPYKLLGQGTNDSAYLLSYKGGNLVVKLPTHYHKDDRLLHLLATSSLYTEKNYVKVELSQNYKTYGILNNDNIQQPLLKIHVDDITLKITDYKDATPINDYHEAFLAASPEKINALFKDINYLLEHDIIPDLYGDNLLDNGNRFIIIDSIETKSLYNNTSLDASSRKTEKNLIYQDLINDFRGNAIRTGVFKQSSSDYVMSNNLIILEKMIKSPECDLDTLEYSLETKGLFKADSTFVKSLFDDERQKTRDSTLSPSPIIKSPKKIEVYNQNYLDEVMFSISR